MSYKPRIVSNETFRISNFPGHHEKNSDRLILPPSLSSSFLGSFIVHFRHIYLFSVYFLELFLFPSHVTLHQTNAIFSSSFLFPFAFLLPVFLPIWSSPFSLSFASLTTRCTLWLLFSTSCLGSLQPRLHRVELR